MGKVFDRIFGIRNPEVKEYAKFAKYAFLVRRVARKVNDERASKCGYDIMMGLSKGDVEDRVEAWEDFLKDYPNGIGCSTQAERDGAWVPAIPLK